MINTVKVTSRVASLGVWQDIPSDSINSAIIVFEFADDWADLVCTAQFTQGNKTYNQLIDDNQCAVPAELHTGEFKLSVFGAKTDGTAYRSTTVPLVKDIIQSGFDGEGETPIPPTPDLYEQLIEEFANGGVHSLNGIKGDMSLVAGDNTAVSVDTDNKEISIDVTVDSAMSDTSENAVQNKIVKEYVDTEIANIPVDSALSDVSENPVQNKVVKNALDAKENISNKVTTITGDEPNPDEIYPSVGAVLGMVNDVIVPEFDNKEDVANKVTSLSASSTDTEYPSAKAVYDELDGKFDKTGGTISGAVMINGALSMVGNLNMGNRQINNLAAPAYANSAARKQYVDDAIAAAIGVVNTTLATLATVEEGE